MERSEDPRKIGLKNGLRQLTIGQLQKVIDYDQEMVLDEYNYHDGKFYPLAVACGLENTEEPTNDKIYNELVRLGYSVYNTRGINGDFYTDNRKRDLFVAAAEVIAEKLEYEKDLLFNLLSHPAGFTIGIEGWLQIRRLESSQFAVCKWFEKLPVSDPNDYEETIYEDLEMAIQKFLEIRIHDNYGLDFRYW